MRNSCPVCWLRCIHSNCGGTSKPLQQQVEAPTSSRRGVTVRRGDPWAPPELRSAPPPQREPASQHPGERLWLQLCKNSFTESLKSFYKCCGVFGVRGILGRTSGWGLGQVRSWGWSPAQLVQTQGQGCLPQALGLMLNAGESGLLTAGPAGPGGTQVTN